MINPNIVLNFQKKISTIIENEYSAFADPANRWWDKVAKVRPSLSHTEVIAWLLSTSQIRSTGDGGNSGFRELAAQTTEIPNEHAGDFFEITEDELKDIYNGIPGGKAFELGAQWATDIGYQMGYWPQKQTAYLLKNELSLGTYQNVFTGAADGAYPGACRIDDGVTTDVAMTNLGKIGAYIRSIKMANGDDPRFLVMESLIVPPRMMARAATLTGAKFIAAAAATGGGSQDVEAEIRFRGMADPVEAPELAGFESDTTFFVVCRQAKTSQLGGVIYQEREPFAMNTFTPEQSPQLAHQGKFKWIVDGRNAIAPGHPYLIFKCKAS
jgi:hypothetical protein